MSKILFCGTYSNLGGEGVYSIGMDERDHFGDTEYTIGKMISPTYCAISKQKHILYAVSEPLTGEKGAIYAWDIKTGDPILINFVQTDGAGLVHLCIDQEEKLLFAVSYRDATVQMYELGENGQIGSMLDRKQHIGQGTNPLRQETAHAHSIWLTKDDQYACVCDLGIDQLVVYYINRADRKLDRKDEWGVKFPDGVGPRHMVFHPYLRKAYVLAELTSEVFTLEYDTHHKFNIVDVTSALENPAVESIGAAIRISADGNYLYASNRGADDIAVFQVNQTGEIHRVKNISCAGKHPRDFIISEDGTQIICANRDSNNISVFERDLNDGNLMFAYDIQGIAAPACLLEYNS